jgi:hypothetical protein
MWRGLARSMAIRLIISTISSPLTDSPPRANKKNRLTLKPRLTTSVLICANVDQWVSRCTIVGGRMKLSRGPLRYLVQFHLLLVLTALIDALSFSGAEAQSRTKLRIATASPSLSYPPIYTAVKRDSSPSVATTSSTAPIEFHPALCSRPSSAATVILTDWNSSR